MACRILVPQSRIELVPPAVEVQGPNHQTSKEFPFIPFCDWLVVCCTNIIHCVYLFMSWWTFGLFLPFFFFFWLVWILLLWTFVSLKICFQLPWVDNQPINWLVPGPPSSRQPLGYENPKMLKSPTVSPPYPRMEVSLTRRAYCIPRSTTPWPEVPLCLTFEEVPN